MKVLALALCTLVACATGGAGSRSDPPTFLVAAQAPPLSVRVAMQAAPVTAGAPVTEIRQFVTFGTDGHVRAVCTVVIRMDGSHLDLPFPDSALALSRARCY